MKQNASGGFRSFLREKGYYIVLLLCAVAVGTSGYFLLTHEPAQTPEVEVVPAVSTQGSTPAPTETTERIPATQESTVPSEEPEQAPQWMPQRPLSGDEVTGFSADALAYNETTRDWRTHEGVDIAAPLQSAVCAAADGSVLTIYEDRQLGMTVVLQHSGGYTTHYANLAPEVPVSVGQHLAAGDTLGTVGQTATIETATVPHLHFSIYQNSSPINPTRFFPGE